jgi:hypothetical protein
LSVSHAQRCTQGNCKSIAPEVPPESCK